jgi:hypothetical protein
MQLQPDEISIPKDDLPGTIWVGKTVDYKGKTYVVVRESGPGHFGHYILRRANVCAEPAPPVEETEDATAVNTTTFGAAAVALALDTIDDVVPSTSDVVPAAFARSDDDDTVPDQAPTPVEVPDSTPEPIILENPDPPAAPDCCDSSDPSDS